MLKGLLTRQIFVVVDILLAAAVVGVAALVGRELMHRETVDAVSDAPSPVEVPSLPKPAPRDKYNPILASRLFGDAGEFKKPVEPPAPVTPAEEVVDNTFTQLKLVATSNTRPFPNALIADMGTGLARVYWPGNEVIPGQAKLHEVNDRWVKLFNIQKNQYETLRMDPEELGGEAGLRIAQRGPGGPAQPGPPPNPNARTISREELSQDLEAMTDNLADLQNTLNPRPVTGPDGKAIGFTADNISSVPLAKKMGLQDGDVVTEINGVPIDSQKAITEVIGKFQNSPQFHIKVLRQGKPTLLQYSITE